jgi:hypothetical protein
MTAQARGSASRKRPRRRVVAWTAKLTLAVFSATLGLVVGEVALRIAGYRAIHDTYSKPEIFWAADPLLGWSHEPGSEGVYVGPRPWPIEYSTPVRINSLGLRGPELTEPPDGGLRLMLLGDSIVAGFEVPYEKTFAHLIGEGLSLELGRPVQSVNAGVRGYGTDQSLLYFRERGRLLEPDFVIFVHTANDPADNTEIHQMRRPFGKPAFAPRHDGSLELVGAPVPQYPICSEYRLTERFEIERRDGRAARLACRFQMAALDHSALASFAALRVPWNADLLRSLYHLGRPPPPSPARNADKPSPARELTHVLLREMAVEVDSAGAGFLVVASHAPTLDLAQLQADGIALVTLESVEGATHQEIRFNNDSHFNEIGHRRVADLLTRVVARQIRGGE